MLRRQDLNLNRSRKERLQKHFHRYKDKQSYDEITAGIKNVPLKSCPHCKSCMTVRYGKYKDRQRYKCKDCSRTFNDFTNTPIHYTHYPEKWTKFLQCIREGLSLRRSQVRVGISWVTLFYWRHKLLHAFLIADQKSQKTKKVIVNLFKVNPYLEEAYPYVCVRNNPPLYEVEFWEREPFAKWVYHFDWIARKYIKRYVSWFRILQQVKEEQEWEAMKKILLYACSVYIEQTYRTLPIVS